MSRRSVLLAGAVALTVSLAIGALPALAQKVGNPSGASFKLKVTSAFLKLRDTEFSFEEGTAPQCNDGVNNDEDLLGGAPQDSNIDFAGGDPQCSSPSDNSEVQGGNQAQIPVTFTGTVAADGTWNVPTSGIVFPQVFLFARADIIGAFIVTVSISGTHAATGNLNANTGAATNRVRLRVDLDGGPLGSDCHIGDAGNPIDVNTFITGTTAPPGPNTPITGTPYNADTGTMTLVNNGFAVPGASGCATFPINVNTELNNSLGLPSPAGSNTAIFEGIFDPVANRPLRAINPVLNVTPGVACRTTSFSAVGSTSVQPITTYGFDYSNDGAIDQLGILQTASTVFPTAGPQTARVRVSDIQGDFTDKLTPFTVGVNQPPTSSFTPNPSPRVQQNGSQAFTLAGSDPESGAVTFSIATPPTNGTVTGSGASRTYNANSGYSGPDSFVFRTTDDCGNFVDKTIPVNVNFVPVANDQSVTTNQTIPVPITLTGTDADPTDTLTYGIATFPANGSLTGTPPNVTYTPNAPFSGTDSFTFTVSDGFGGTDTGTVTINVIPNIFPVADDQNLTTAEDTALPITLTGNDPDGDPITFTANDPPNGSITGTGANITYTPDSNFNGTDTFTFVVADNRGGSDTGTITVVVTSVNDAPDAQNQSLLVTENTPTPITLGATDADGDSIGYAIGTPPTNGSLSGIPPNVTYTPNTGYNGPDSFTFDVSDGNGGTDSATVIINVVPVNDPPSADNQFVSTQEDTALPITLTGTDPEGFPLTFSVTGSPTNGSLSGTAPNLTYTPGSNFNGFDSFTFSVFDGQNTANGTITIAVLAADDAPVAQAQSVSTPEDTAAGITLGATDVDDSPGSLIFQIISGPSNGSLSGSGTSRTYTPNANYNGPDSFVFQVKDPQGLSTTATVSITVTPVNDAPKATGSTKSTQEDTAVGLTLTGTDIDGDSLTFTVLGGPANGTLTGAAPNLTYTPASNFNGFDSFTFEAKDGDGATGTATFAIAVLAVNDAPVANPQSVTTVEDTPTPITLTATDPDGDTLTYKVEVGPARGTVTGTAPNITYTPAADYNGGDSIVFSVRDPGGKSSTATVTINVTGAPIIATKMSADPVVAKLQNLKWYYPQLRAHLHRVDNNAAVVGRTVGFIVQGKFVCSAVTDVSGTATCGGTSNSALIAQNYTASFAGDHDFGASSATGTVVR